ncbi:MULTISPECIES: ABC transporter ATP-binding protein [Micromonospora]|uniref:ABC transporter ATP-binding protein n=1 Tax=Micromonospora TaxID=1873 RepID=UPI000CE3530B|nr:MULTISPECIES: ABC transporter ATP-binding protein [Micromonospora]MBP1782102.1 oligopeptide/dipeptide ABC transporter ATP-binding protein [Micromonospora sp. HB375]MBQ1062612.1 ABC transporter ATP-binding protein [Micromonospora sp. C41]MDH6470823.1 peptide/nickel transport system ATP-binding protein [Micromonospora sp. H404/HB375]NHO83493.1 ABC transporter ATP-binding protein [Micromonospora sp. CMU55-4]
MSAPRQALSRPTNTGQGADREPRLLEVSGLTTRFDTPDGLVHAVNGVDFHVDRAEIVGVVGESGCGKSVTIRSILGLVRPPGRVVEGTARFNGVDLLGLRAAELRRLRGAEIGFIAQNPFSALNPVMRIHRQFANILAAHGIRSDAIARDRARDALADVGIAGPDRVLDGYAHQLSGGMAQRVVIAMAMLLNPAFVIADEPTTGLDLTVQRQILDLIRGLVQQHGRSMLLVTHDLGVVAQYCDRVVVMYAGKVIEHGSVRDVLTSPQHPYTQALVRAVPRPGHPLVHLTGRLPDLVDYPAGCPFQARCPHAFEPCGQVFPEPTTSASGRTYWCHLSQEREAAR